MTTATPQPSTLQGALDDAFAGIARQLQAFKPQPVPREAGTLVSVLFDPVPLARMAAAQRAVQDAAHALPDDTGERLVGAEADREQVTEAARQAIATFLAEQESKPAAPASGPKTKPS